MIKSYNDYIFENNISKISRHYNKVIKLIKPFYQSKLYINILPYYKIYKTLYKNSNLDLNDYEILLLVVSSFSRIMNDDKTNIDILEEEIRKNNIHELYNSSFKILSTIYKLILIINKTERDLQVLFDNQFILELINDYVNNKKIDIYQFNSIFDENQYLEIINYINKNF